MDLILNAGGIAGYPEGIFAVQTHFAGCKRVALIPYAYVGDHTEALQFMRDLIPDIPFIAMDEGNPSAVLSTADGIWVPGGNSFVLVNELHARDLIGQVRRSVESGIPYGGSSAGAIVAGPTICTTNDMPIVLAPRSLSGFGLVPFQINAHYLDANTMPPGFRGESREKRIEEFQALNDVVVIGLREGSWLTVHESRMQLDGGLAAVLFKRGRQPEEVPSGSDLSWLLAETPRFGVPVFKP